VTRVVLDTSVVVSALLSLAGPNAQILELIRRKQLRAYATDALFEEYERVFQY